MLSISLRGNIGIDRLPQCLCSVRSRTSAHLCGRTQMNSFRTALRGVALAVVTTAVTTAAVSVAQAAGNSYQQHNLVSDGTIPADHTDRNLVNAWGIAFNPTAFVWVTDNKT